MCAKTFQNFFPSRKIHIQRWTLMDNFPRSSCQKLMNGRSAWYLIATNYFPPYLFIPIKPINCSRIINAAKAARKKFHILNSEFWVIWLKQTSFELQLNGIKAAKWRENWINSFTWEFHNYSHLFNKQQFGRRLAKEELQRRILHNFNSWENNFHHFFSYFQFCEANRAFNGNSSDS